MRRSTESFKKELICVLSFIVNKSLQLRTRLVNSIENNIKFCQLPFRKRSAMALFTDTRVVTAGLRYFFTRATEHIGIYIFTGKCLKSVKQSAVSNHLLECNCSIDFDHFDILASDANKFRHLIKESLLMKRDQLQLSFPLKLLD